MKTAIHTATVPEPSSLALAVAALLATLGVACRQDNVLIIAHKLKGQLGPRRRATSKVMPR